MEPNLAQEPKEEKTGKQQSSYSRTQYVAALAAFDAAICEANAVSQAQAGRMAAPNVGYATHVFAKMCGSGNSMMRSAPLSRWVRSDFEDWQFGAVAGHARSLLDGYLLFNYLIDPPGSEAELQARINIMHLNDCTRRIELHTDLGFEGDLEGFEKQRQELREHLVDNEFFTALPAAVQKNCLNGRFLMISTRDELLDKIGFPKGQFDALYDLWSQHVHILPMSFYRMEPNGRGTGIENETDRAYLGQALTICAAILAEVTETIVFQFPDVAEVRKGAKSTFWPGPAANRPKKNGPTNKPPPAMPLSGLSGLSTAMAGLFGKAI